MQRAAVQPTACGSAGRRATEVDGRRDLAFGHLRGLPETTVPSCHRDLQRPRLRALAFVDERELVRDLVELVSVPSVSGSDAECDVQHQLAKRSGRLGLDVDLWQLDLDRLTTDPGFPGWRRRAPGLGLVASSGAGRPDLVLQGHVDVVPSGDPAAWRTDPFAAALGRRSHRSRPRSRHLRRKAGVVANLAAVRAVRAAGIELSKPYAVHLVVGEEDGGLGAFARPRKRGHRGRACIITEPTSGTITTANAGRSRSSCGCPGRDPREHAGTPASARWRSS